MDALRNIFIGLLITTFFCVAESNAKNNFVRVNLSKGVSVELPRNWYAMSHNKRITLDTWKESVLEARNLSDIENDLSFAASYYDDRGNTVGSFVIRFYPQIDVSQSEAIAGGAIFVKELNEGIRDSFTKGTEAGGAKMLSWLGTVRKSINESVYFISEFRQLSPNRKEFRGFLVRYLNMGKSFTIIIQYREDQEYLLRPICSRIISSIQH